MKVSDSKLDSIDIYFVRYNKFYRTGETSDSVQYNVSSEIKLYDSNGGLLLYNNESVYLNGHSIFRSVDIHSGEYYYYFHFATNEQNQIGAYQFNNWQCISGNGVSDMILNDTALPLYTTAVPYNIVCSNGFSITINNTLFPSADSVKILLLDYNNNDIDTTVSTNAGTVYFPPAVFSNFHLGPMRTGLQLWGKRKNHTYIINGKKITLHNYSASFYDINYNP